MPTYTYKARDSLGKAINGAMEASGDHMVASQLDGLGYTPVYIKEKRNEIISLDLLQKHRAVSLENLILFTRQLRTLFGAGVSLLAGLDVMAEQTENKRMKAVIDGVRGDVEAGSTLSDALSKHPRVFSPLYISMIQAGEAAGTLEEILHRLASVTEYEKDTRARIKAATRYPKMVVIVISVAFIIMVTFVIPKFTTMFMRFGGTLPLPTRVMIGLDHIIHHYWYLIVTVIASIVLGFYWYTNTERGRLRWDSLKIRIPVFGQLFLKIAMSRFTYMLGMLIRSGLPIVRALEITSATIGNTTISKAVERIKQAVSEGKGLSSPLKEGRVFTPMVVQMISVGEKSGKMDDALAKISDYYNLEVEYTIKNLSTLIEPVLIFVLGIMVLFMALAIFLPMWDMASLFRPT